jgi:murein DD-endopeptidase MepM/ murein hydrolase activator NlpD
VAGLVERGINARAAELANAGRPDVILALATVPGGRNEAWFCDPGPEQSSILAFALLDSVGLGGDVTAPADAPLSDFPCDEVHAGRAQVPAVLLELAEAGSYDASVIVSALDGYFQKQRAQVLAARAAPRLVWPALGPVTSHYSANHPLGIDIGQSEGPITAATDGVVSFAGGNVCCSYGLYVVVEGQDGIGTLYAHLSSIAVSEGQRVRQGDVLGEVGCTGTCFGTHLHFEVFQSDRRQNPMRFLP